MKKIFAVCLMAAFALGCVDLNQGTTGGNEGEPGTEPENGNTGQENGNSGQEVVKFPTLLGMGEDKVAFDRKGTEVSTYEVVSFHIFEEDLVSLEDRCDSLVWTVKGADGSHIIVSNGKPRTPTQGRQNDWEHYSTKASEYASQFCPSSTIDWKHYFTKAGEYETYLDAWKDNEIVNRDVFLVTVRDSERDFLHMNWADMARGSRKELSSALMEQKFKIFYRENDDGSPYMEIIALSVAEKRQVLYDFMVEAYGDPAMAADDDKLREYYEANFLARKPDECPIAIWCHEPNQVVLLAVNDEQGNARRHLLHIEPSLF